MESRFHEKVREYQGLIEGATDPTERSRIENDMYQYMIQSAPFIKEYHEEALAEERTCTVAGVKVKTRKGVQRQDIFKSYLETVEGESSRSVRKKTDVHFDTCHHCGALYSIVIDDVTSDEICRECGRASFHLGNEVGFKEEQDMETSIVYSYKRENHFNEWVSQFQAKESTNIPKEVLDQLRAEFKKQKVRESGDITHEKVKTLLKKLGHSRFYEHVPYIATILSGIQPPTMSSVLEERLRLMFHQIQKPFEKHRPKDRKNFLSYSYVLYKFCELLGEDDFLPCFPLLKSREKLCVQDKIWEKICHELRWQYIPTV